MFDDQKQDTEQESIESTAIEDSSVEDQETNFGWTDSPSRRICICEGKISEYNAILLLLAIIEVFVDFVLITVHLVAINKIWILKDK